MENKQLSSGLPGLDRVVGSILAGDNVVWQIDAIEDFLPFVAPYCDYARRVGRPLIYFRFADHAPLVGPETGARICAIDPAAGFESFLFEVHRVIEEAGRGAFYVFDSLSLLAQRWYSDQMLANFFMLTCPYLFDLATVAFFPILRNHHSSHATSPITDTTQLLLDVYRYQDTLYVRPIKVQHRYSPTMYMLHAWRGDDFPSVTDSITISEILSRAPRPEMQAGPADLNVWNRTFNQAEALLARGDGETAPEARELFDRILQMALSRDERMMALCRQHFQLQDLLRIGARVIGTGLIGGKSVGMLLARRILRQSFEPWRRLREKHDSFFIASDVFYTYLVRNGCWWVRESQRNPDTFLKGASEARRQILRGAFPEDLVRQFSDMLDYFGQSPIIVRSSSLLEDNFGNAFSGKYESVFCANQGPRAKRLADFISAVQTIYASTMSDDALRYRARRGLLDRDEQMALLVQRVSGAQYGDLFYPHIGGVGFSYNPYVWHEDIDPEAGVARMVFGLGTRAVDRSDDDYTRVVALNAPDKRPEHTQAEIGQFAQHKVDVLDLGANQLMSMAFREVAESQPQWPIDLFASRDHGVEAMARERGMKNVFSWVLTLDGVLARTDFVAHMREILRILAQAYDYPVDIEFTVNSMAPDQYRINLVQCRPLQVQGGGVIKDPPTDLSAADTILDARGAVIGQSRLCAVDRLVYVVPSLYARMGIQDRYSLARVIGRVVRALCADAAPTIMLIGPGRWGTTTPSLGVPVSFADISHVAILCEIVAMDEHVTPDVSLGTHFFSEIVENEMLYMALFPDREGSCLNEATLLAQENLLPELDPEATAQQIEAVRVIGADRLAGGGRHLVMNANTLKQRVVCYQAHPQDTPPSRS